MKPIVVYYSRKGSNEYLARMISERLHCDIERIKPRLNSFPLFLMKVDFGIRRLKHNLREYDHIILCGPVWMGSFIPPLRRFVLKYYNSITNLTFVTCCGSSFEKKDEKYGHGLVFNDIKGILQEKCVQCQAFPIVMVLPEDKKEDPSTFLNTHLNDFNFKGEIRERFEVFIQNFLQRTIA